MNKILIGGVTSSSGKTTLTCGLLRVFKKRGISVAPFKVGPDYIDPAYHHRASGVYSSNLDEFMLPKEELLGLFHRRAENSDISVVEGVMGLFDGYGATKDFCSTAQMAKILQTPVILVIDAKSMAASAAAIIHGYSTLDPDITIAGVILNRVSSKRHKEILTKSILEYTGVPVIGAIPKDENFTLGSRHLGLISSVEIEDLDKKLDYIASVIEEHVDMELLMKISHCSSTIDSFQRRKELPYQGKVTLALAQDKAFHFYYQDALDLLVEMGVQIVPFSPLEDEKLPPCNGIYIGGGYPELFAEELSENKTMLNAIRVKGDQGFPIYGECGGLMYLGESLEDLNQREHSMVGLIPGKSVMKNRLQRFGYCQGKSSDNQIVSSKDMILKGHEFHYSDFITDAKTVYKMTKEQDGALIREWGGGYKTENVLGAYLHIHFCGDYKTAECFIRSMEEKHD